MAHLESHGFVVRVLDSDDPDHIADKANDATVLLIGYTPVGEALLSRLPLLKLICTQSAGVDTVDLDAAARRGVCVANVPDAASEEVASHALAMGCGLLRGLPFLDRAVRSGTWDGSTERLRRLSASTLGVVGMGRIGRRLAAMAQPLFATVLGHDPLLPVDRWPPGMSPCNLDDLMARSDVVSLHAPLTPSNRGIIGAPQLGLMRAGSMLVNVARGELIDHTALMDALDAGRLGGAALDVFPEEPPTDLRLLQHPRLWLSPHAAYLSDASARDYVMTQAENATSWLTTGTVVHSVVVGE